MLMVTDLSSPSKIGRIALGFQWVRGQAMLGKRGVSMGWMICFNGLHDLCWALGFCLELVF